MGEGRESLLVAFCPSGSGSRRGSTGGRTHGGPETSRYGGTSQKSAISKLDRKVALFLFKCSQGQALTAPGRLIAARALEGCSFGGACRIVIEPPPA